MANTVFRDSAGEIMFVTTNKNLFDGFNSGQYSLVLNGECDVLITSYKYKEVKNYKEYHLKLRERITADARCELLTEHCTFIKQRKTNEKRKN